MPVDPVSRARLRIMIMHVAWLLERLRAAGIKCVAVVDLTHPGLRVPVVRVVIPGLEALHDAPGYLPGARARAVRLAVQPNAS